jgi:hypothetical protein
MKKSELLDELAKLASMQAAQDALWDKRLEAYVQGKLSQEQLVELKEAAAADESLALALDCFCPLGADFQAKLVERLIVHPEISKQPAEVLDLKPKWFFSPKALATAACLAAAAVVILFFFKGPWIQEEYAPLPGYAMSLHGYIKQVRGSEEIPKIDLPRYRIGSVMEIALRPATAAKGPVELTVYAEQGEDRQAISLPFEQDPQGAIRIRAKLGRDLSLPPGRWSLHLILHRPGQESDLNGGQQGLSECVHKRIDVLIEEE